MSAATKERWDLAEQLKAGDKVIKSLYWGNDQGTTDTLITIDSIQGLLITHGHQSVPLCDYSSKTSTTRWRIPTERDLKNAELQARITEIDAAVEKLGAEKAALLKAKGNE